MGLKDIYLNAEDKYYKVLEKIDETIPITKVTDAIDSVVPSFAVLIVLLVLILGIIIFPFAFPAETGGTYSFSVIVKDEQGKKLNGTKVKVLFGEKEEIIETDSNGKVSFEAIKGTKIKIEINETGYEIFTREFTLNETDTVINALLKELEIQEQTQATLRFKDQYNKYITEKEITIELGCQNSSVEINPSIVKDNDEDGEIIVDLPLGCGKLVVKSVEVEGYENWFGTIDSAIETIKLESISLSSALGDLRVIVENTASELLEEIEVKLMQGNSIIETKETTSGIAYFNSMEIGYYDLLIQDPNNNYETKKVYSIKIENEKVNEKKVELDLSVKETLKITVLDKHSGERIQNAKVIIENELGEVIGEKETGEDAETLEFALFESGENLIIKASAEDYLPESIESDETELDIELEKITSENSGKLTINLLDEDGKKIENAKVMLKNEDGSLMTEYPEKVTDANGQAEYQGLKEGKYYVFAQKYPASGTSELFEIILTEENTIEFVLEIGNAIFQLSTVDRDGIAIPNTRVKVKSLEWEKEYTLDSEGKTEIELKADKRVYFEFYDPNGEYVSFTSREYQLLPREYVIQVNLEDQIEGEELFVELKGIYLNGIEQEELVEDTKYTAIVELFVPKNADYDEAGIHFRTGNDENPFLENDNLWIEKINASKAIKTKGTTFNPKKGQTKDFDADNSASINAKAKWVNIVWTNVKPGVYQAEIEIRVKEETTTNDQLTLSYRAWGKGNNYYYFPADNELGSSSGNTTKQGLYAEVFKKEFNAQEQIPLCPNEDFCMTEQTLYDKAEEPFLIQKTLPFKTKTNGIYEFNFRIISDSEFTFNEPEIWVKLIDASEEETIDAEISYYEIKTAESSVKKNDALNDSSTQGITLGRIEKGSVIEGKIGIKTKNTSTIFLNLALYEKVSEGSNKIFNNEKETQIKITSGKELQIEVKPELIPAYALTPVTITVKDETGLEVEDAKVTFNVISRGNRRIEIDSAKTNREGEVEFTVIAWHPNTRIEFKAEKFNYEEVAIEKTISEEVFTLEPTSINETLSIRNNPSIEQQITIKNLLETNLKIKEISLTNDPVSNFEGFINIGLMKGKFDQFEGNTVPSWPYEYPDFVFEAKLQNGLPENYTKNARGILTIELENTDFDAVYSEEVEVSLSLGQGERIEEDSCLEIVNGETNFSRQTTSQRVELSYEIANNCMDSQGNFIPVNNLKAKIDWSSKKGSVLLDMKGNNIELQETITKRFTSTVRKEEKIIATLTYIPDTEFTGEEGVTEFTVIIGAELNTATGIQEIHASDNIHGKIGNIDLLECITFDPKPSLGAVIERGFRETEFTVTNSCGVDIELRFCDGDNRCKGGTEEGGIIVTPNTNVNTLKIRAGNDNTERVKVERTSIPGIYGITVEAKRKDNAESWRQITVYDIIVKPDSGHYFDLGTYTMVVTEKNVPDIIELENNNLFTTVDVDASNCAWDKAKKNNWKEAGHYAASGIVGGAAGAGTAIALNYTIMAVSTAGGIATAGVGLILGLILCALFCPDPCDDRTTVEMSDFLINLSGQITNHNKTDRNLPNLVDIDLSLQGIEVGWNFEEAVLTYLNQAPGKETLPLTFTKTTNTIDSIEPKYGILTVNATQHNQETSLRIPGDDGHAGDILNFGLPDNYSTTRLDWGGINIGLFNDLTEVKRKFHVRAITKRYIQEIPPLNRSLDCIKPTGEIGAKGEDALPKVKLDWDWQNISFNECEQGNENYIYCDSTQFAIMLNERIKKIDEFMENNGYSFSCPATPGEEEAESTWDVIRQHNVSNGKIGIKEVQIETKEETEKTRVTVIIENKTEKTRGLNVEIYLTVPEEAEYSGDTSCVKPTGSITKKGGTKTVYCEFELPKSITPYEFEVRHISREDALLEKNRIFSSIYDSYIYDISYRLNKESRCWAGTTTEFYAELFSLNFYLNATDPNFGKYVKQDKVNFDGREIDTDDEEIINVIEEIKKLSHFNAYLIKDGFSEDFKQDFAYYYETKNFMDTPTWFTDSNPETENNELSTYYKEEDLLSFNKKYLDEREFALVYPGLYRVDLSINYLNDKWNLFDAEGKPNATIKVEFTRLDTPEADSILYYLPFDGAIGEENSAYHRIGYGSGYQNLSNEELKINSDLTLSPSNTESNPLKEISVKKIDSLIEMNSDEETRGSILRINYEGTSTKMNFYPSKATPVVFKMFKTKTSSTEEEFSYYYGMQENEIPILAGTQRLTFWKGLGRCRDFEGKFVQNYKRWDSKAESEIQNSQNLYGIKWNNAVNGGNTYLKTVLYSPIERNIQLKRTEGSLTQKSSFYTPDLSDSPLVPLNGIAGMQFNDSTQGSSDYLRNIQNVFDLVKEGKACISQNDISMNVYWNEQNLYRQKGSKTSINDLEETLRAGSECIE